MLTRDSQQLVSDIDGRLILMLMHGILPPVFQKLLHICSKLSRTCSLVRSSKGAWVNSMFTPDA